MPILDGLFASGDPRVVFALVRGLKWLSNEHWRDGIPLPEHVRSALQELEELHSRHVARGSTAHNGTSGMPLDPTPYTLSVVQAAPVLGVKPRAVRALAQRGSIRAGKRRGAWTFEPADIADYLDSKASR